MERPTPTWMVNAVTLRRGWRRPCGDATPVDRLSRAVASLHGTHVADAAREEPARVAHRSETEHVPVTLGDVNHTVDAIEEIFIKYYAIIVGPSLMGLEPSLIGNWMAPFEIPWLLTEEQ